MNESDFAQRAVHVASVIQSEKECILGEYHHQVYARYPIVTCVMPFVPHFRPHYNINVVCEGK